MMPARSPAEADVVVVNTCSVTAHADRTARAFLRRVHRENPAARILVTGCYAQRAPREVAALPGVGAVVGNSHKSLVPRLAADAAFVPLESLGRVDDSLKGVSIYADQIFAHAWLASAEPAAAFSSLSACQTRPALKVQDGCGNRCSFCVIPTTRGPSRSLPLAVCLRSAAAFAGAGGKELVLSGINLGRWGRDLTPSGTLEQLVSAILSETSLERLRLSSIEPMDWTPELLSLFQPEPSLRGLARHAHLPLQSGSDATLRAMHRRYRPWHYAEKLRAIRRRMPDAAIGADVMVGFPSESKARFEESFAFIEAQPFTYLHLFPFSARPGTAAWELAERDPVPPQAVAVRMRRLRQLIAAKNLAFRKSFVGRELPVITLGMREREQGQGFTRALTDNFLEMRLAGSLPANRSLFATVTGVAGEGLAGYAAA
jgi:threonylcarbamoyladenosine tRNA methylthiotransferase MtaB